MHVIAFQSREAATAPSPQPHRHRRCPEVHHQHTIWSHLSDECSEEEDDACNQDYLAEPPKVERSHAQSNTVFSADEKLHFVELSILSESWASQFENELRKSTDQYIAPLRTLSHGFANNLPTYVEERRSTPPPPSPWQLPSAGTSASLTSANSSIPTLQSSTEESTLSGRFWKASPTSSLSSSTGSCLRPYDMPFTLSTVSKDLDWLVDHSECWTPGAAPKAPTPITAATHAANVTKCLSVRTYTARASCWGSHTSVVGLFFARAVCDDTQTALSAYITKHPWPALRLKAIIRTPMSMPPFDRNYVVHTTCGARGLRSG